MVYLQYCDGSMHSGARVSATNDTFGLYFSGHHTIAAVLQHLSLHDTLNASEGVRVVFAGGSAGGVGVFSNVEYVAEVLPHAKVLGAPIGGFVPEIQWFRGPFSSPPPDDLRTPAFVRLVSLYQSFLPRGCVAALGSESWRCELPAFSYSHITVPLFMIEAITDSVVLGGCVQKASVSHPQSLVSLLTLCRWAQVRGCGAGVSADAGRGGLGLGVRAELERKHGTGAAARRAVRGILPAALRVHPQRPFDPGAKCDRGSARVGGGALSGRRGARRAPLQRRARRERQILAALGGALPAEAHRKCDRVFESDEYIGLVFQLGER